MIVCTESMKSKHGGNSHSLLSGERPDGMYRSVVVDDARSPETQGLVTSSTTRLSIWPVALMVTSAALLCGCGSEASIPEVKTGSPEALHSELERGPVKVSIDIVPKEPRLSDEPTLTLTVIAEDGVDVTPPPFGQSMGDFIIRDFYEPLPKTADGRKLIQQVYTLEPTVAGLSMIQPIVVKFIDHRPTGDGQEHTIETEAIKVQIATMIEAEAPSLNDLRPVAAPVALPPNIIVTWWHWGLGIVIALATLAAIAWLLTRRKQSSEPQLTPQQLAWKELNDLISSKLSETDVKEYFVQLTGVVRRYIERSTGVKAPEQTTEEFLRQVSQRKIFSAEEDRRLGAFLESADLVKFAGYQPDEEMVKQSTHKAKQFIELKTAESLLGGTTDKMSQVVKSASVKTSSQLAGVSTSVDDEVSA